MRERMRGEEMIVKSSLFRVFGLGEARVKEVVEGIRGNIELAFLPSFPEIHLRVIVRGTDEKEIAARHNQCENELYDRLGNYLYSKGDEVLEGVVGRLLREGKATLAVAESCTGGLIAHRITEIPGSSDYFIRGVVAYTNKSKEELLGVPTETLKKYGPVSKEVAQQMAEGVRESSKASIGVATTGIAGPQGGTPETPVGRVYIALAADGLHEVKQYDFFGDRHQIKVMASAVALDRVRRYLLAI
jgi:nicotinamide-nucleotide amidase